MAEERLILDERILPELKKFCKERNFDVRFIDLNIDDGQFNYEDWKNEIKIAHQESTGVGFIVSGKTLILIKLNSCVYIQFSFSNSFPFKFIEKF